MGLYKCSTTAEERQVQAGDPKKAAEVFLDEIYMGMYKVKLKKVTFIAAKGHPDKTVFVTDMMTQKVTYFQLVQMNRK